MTAKKTKPLSDDQKKLKTEAVAKGINDLLEKHGCVIGVNRWIDNDGRVQAGMTISVKE